MISKNLHVRTVHDGFTVIEVLAATALASVLMVVVLGVLTGMTRKERLLESQHSPIWHDRIVRQLTADLSGASRFSTGPGVLTIVANSDSCSEQPKWLPTEIRYEVIEAGDVRLLIRTTRPLTQLTTAQSSRLVCMGIDSLSLCKVREHSVDDGELVALDEGVLPPRVRVVLEEGGETILDCPLMLY